MQAPLPPIDFKAELNDEQYAAVTSEPGPALVLAGAGSGKTRTLTYRVAYLLHQGVQPYEILLLTFTNKASREMLERVEELTGINGRQLWGGTFHSIAQRILRVHGDLVGLQRNYTILDQGEAEAILKNVIQTLDSKFIKTKNNPKPKVVADMISYARNTCREPREEADERYPFLDGMADKVDKFYKAYKQAKLDQQVVDYDDLLEYFLKLLREQTEIREQYQARFKHILVDEFQDTNRLQSDIVDQLAGHHQVMAVGDDAQCIYTWRGADFDNIMQFEERHPGAEIHKIETNYRSSPEILGFANAVLASQPSGLGFSKELRAIKPSRERPYFVPVMDTRGQAKFIIERIEGLVDEGRNLSDIAILYRAHFQAMDLQMELTRLNIDYQITSGVRFFEQAHIKDFTAQLRFASNPADVSAFARFTCLLPKVGPKTAERIHKFTRERAAKLEKNFCDVLVSPEVLKKVPADAKEEWPSLAETIREVSAALTERAPEEIIQLALDGWYSSYIREIYPNWTDRADDLQSLVSFANRFETMEELLAQLVLLASESNERSPEEQQNCLRLTTIHQAKGLEFPVVFVIGLADGTFPLKRTIDAGDLEEERRLFYVAVTRAEEELYMSYPMLNNQGNQVMRLNPSRFIQEIDPSRYETLRVAPTRRY
ncbi:ATP-dependent helicase [Coraliomargarita sp. SDUM461003]|uniref:DNA 3'-5' helicase n=1 Tax=Thalassobacterium maritimum TaxID=3041265 RepID=A0ABU1AU34_9BACT|nr:ATP-dependent helicase [Coraliomargarita sp. SDUM461003]MDQ8207676.1 ATP-dependent helicase [Coraliomargarita sp. SDUM461003]